MTVQKTDVITSRLERKGFVVNKDADHIQLVLYVNGVKTRVRTKMSHGKREIGDDLILRCPSS